MTHKPKEQLINTLEAALRILTTHEKNVSSIIINPKYQGSNSYENGGVETEIRNSLGSPIVYKNGMPKMYNATISDLPRLPYLHLSKHNTQQLLDLLKAEPKSTKPEIPKPTDNKTPQTLYAGDAQCLYLLSRCYDVMYLQKGSQTELIIDDNINNIESHNTIQGSTQPFISDFYIKYDSSNEKYDLRRKTFPKVDILRYKYSPDAEYVNLPTDIRGRIQISNSGSPLLPLSKDQYKQYI